MNIVKACMIRAGSDGKPGAPRVPRAVSIPDIAYCAITDADLVSSVDLKTVGNMAVNHLFACETPEQCKQYIDELNEFRFNHRGSLPINFKPKPVATASLMNGLDRQDVVFLAADGEIFFLREQVEAAVKTPETEAIQPVPSVSLVRKIPVREIKDCDADGTLVEPKSQYDSRVPTWEHIHKVQGYLGKIVADLQRRAYVHDQSKLVAPEVALFDKYTPKLAGVTYGSDEYKSCLESLAPALAHHYSVNDHHPEFHCGGIKAMSLVQLTELLADWKAASERHIDGDVRKSIEINQKRFGYSDELKQILLNTLPLLEA